MKNSSSAAKRRRVFFRRDREQVLSVRQVGYSRKQAINSCTNVANLSPRHEVGTKIVQGAVNATQKIPTLSGGLRVTSRVKRPVRAGNACRALRPHWRAWQVSGWCRCRQADD